jgi:hypothetical protein
MGVSNTMMVDRKTHHALVLAAEYVPTPDKEQRIQFSGAHSEFWSFEDRNLTKTKLSLSKEIP